MTDPYQTPYQRVNWTNELFTSLFASVLHRLEISGQTNFWHFYDACDGDNYSKGEK